MTDRLTGRLTDTLRYGIINRNRPHLVHTMRPKSGNSRTLLKPVFRVIITARWPTLLTTPRQSSHFCIPYITSMCPELLTFCASSQWWSRSRQQLQSLSVNVTEREKNSIVWDFNSWNVFSYWSLKTGKNNWFSSAVFCAIFLFLVVIILLAYSYMQEIIFLHWDNGYL